MHKYLPPFLCLLTCASAVGGAVGRQATSQASSVQTIDVETVGPKVGDAMPDFSLRDQRGHTHSLPSLLGPNGAVIVFFRSADW